MKKFVVIGKVQTNGAGQRLELVERVDTRQEAEELIKHFLNRNETCGIGEAFVSIVEFPLTADTFTAAMRMLMEPKEIYF